MNPPNNNQRPTPQGQHSHTPYNNRRSVPPNRPNVPPPNRGNVPPNGKVQMPMGAYARPTQGNASYYAKTPSPTAQGKEGATLRGTNTNYTPYGAKYTPNNVGAKSTVPPQQGQVPYGRGQGKNYAGTPLQGGYSKSTTPPIPHVPPRPTQSSAEPSVPSRNRRLNSDTHVPPPYQSTYYTNHQHQPKAARQAQQHGARSSSPNAKKAQTHVPTNFASKCKQFFGRYSKVQLVLLVACVCICVVSSYKLLAYANNSIKQSKALKAAENIFDQKDVARDVLNQTEEPTPTPMPTKAPQKKQKKKNAKSVATATPVPATPTPEPLPLSPDQVRNFPKKYYGNELNRIRDKFFDLLNINEDIVGWIRIGDLVSQPVVKRDNEFYLTHNYRKDENPAGAIFADESSDLRTPPENLILHGHNMRNGSMFGRLIHYKNSRGVKFFLDNPMIQFDSLYQDGDYVIFSIFEIETNYNSPNYFPFIAYNQFGSDADAMNFIKSVRSRSLFNVPIDVEPSDSLLTLATCTLNSESTRLLVVARKTRPNENLKALKDSIFRTTRVR